MMGVGSNTQLALDAMTPGFPVKLTGDAASRGLGQSAGAPELRAAVAGAIMGRIETAGDVLAHAADFLPAQWKFMQEHAPDQLAQVQAIAEGYGITADDLFAYLHIGLIEDADGALGAEEDGCSVVACRTANTGPVLAKNRDYRGEHRALQRVFLESDPAWGGRRILSVGSLGSPGAFSSGMNSDGLALADTRIGWRRPNTGWLRYFLMNEILIRAGTVVEALNFIASQPHAGGGSLVLMDASGQAAAVELGSDRIHTRTSHRTGIGQTNHFLDPKLYEGKSCSSSDRDGSNSHGRLNRIGNWIGESEREQPTLETMAALLASHAMGARSALCRHLVPDRSETISTSLFACASRMLYFCPGNPCKDDWQSYTL